jgi:hypothetical protein
MAHQVRHLLISAAWLAMSCTTFYAGAQSQPAMTEPAPDPSDKLQADLCASKTGDAREACLREGQDRQITDGVRGDVRAASTNSDYNVARAKCDTLSGDAKDKCIAAAKKKYKP